MGALTLIGPTIALAAGFALTLFWPAVGRFALGTVVLLIPWLNPVVAGVGIGRMYLSHALVLGAVFSGVLVMGKHPAKGRLLVAFALALAYTVEVGFTRVNAIETAGWTFRPLFPFLTTAATILLIPVDRRERWFQFLAYGGILGCSLAVLYALAPQIDPFAFTRPTDIPFVARIGPFVRATGGFVYPNNLGMFAGYGGLLATSSLLLARPRLSRTLATTLLVTALLALAFSASRAATGGFLLGSTLLLYRANIGKKLASVTIAVFMAVGAVLLLLGSEQGQDLVEERVTTATGSSLESRQDSWAYAWERFSESPLFGTGIEESRLDSSWHLYLYTGGLVGVALLGTLAASLWGPALRRAAGERELAGALLIAMASTAFIQDSLGQTLAAWYPAVMLGLISGKIVSENRSQRRKWRPRRGRAASSLR